VRHRILAVVATGVAIYVAGLMVLAPAELLDLGLQRVSQERLRLVAVTGTLWSGQGMIEMLDSAGRNVTATPVTWSLKPASLLSGQLRVDLQVGQSGPAFPLRWSRSGLAIEHAEIRLPAMILGLWQPQLAVLGLTGEMQLIVSGLSIDHRLDQQQAHGQLTLRLRDAGSSFTPVFPLGDYEVRLDGKGGEVGIQLQTLKGPLQIDGHGAWKIGKTPEFLAVAQLGPELMVPLAPLLRLIAVERATGRFELQFKQ
jgi:general secretion pathway protein N